MTSPSSVSTGAGHNDERTDQIRLVPPGERPSSQWLKPTQNNSDVDGPSKRITGDLCGSLAEKRVAVLVNGKPNAGLLLSSVAESLANTTGMRLGPVLGKRSAAEPADAEVLDNLRRSAEVVLTGSGD
jgi:hypothetical protein